MNYEVSIAQPPQLANLLEMTIGASLAILYLDDSSLVRQDNTRAFVEHKVA